LSLPGRNISAIIAKYNQGGQVVPRLQVPVARVTPNQQLHTMTNNDDHQIAQQQLPRPRLITAQPSVPAPAPPPTGRQAQALSKQVVPGQPVPPLQRSLTFDSIPSHNQRQHQQRQDVAPSTQLLNQSVIESRSGVRGMINRTNTVQLPDVVPQMRPFIAAHTPVKPNTQHQPPDDSNLERCVCMPNVRSK
jgi:hypothetical protein